MLTFTTQQLAGGVRYSQGVKIGVSKNVNHLLHNVFQKLYTLTAAPPLPPPPLPPSIFSYGIGNWDEDISRVEIASRDFESRRSKGELLHLRKARETAFLAQSAPQSYSPDGLLRYNNTLMLGTGSEGAPPVFLSNHIFSLLSPGHCRVTAGEARSGAQSRNVWTLRAIAAGKRGGWVRAPGVPLDNIVRFGDRMRLECDPALVADTDTRVCGLPMALHSSRGNNLLGTSRKGKQEVSMCVAGADDADAEWMVACASGDSLTTTGEAVAVGAPFTLLHVMSNVMLATRAGDVYPSEFGSELDVHCCTVKGTGQASANHAGGLAPVPAQEPNVWRFYAAADASSAIDTRGFIPLSPASLLTRARASVASAAGMHGFRSLALSMSNLDPRASGALPASGLKAALVAHGVIFTDAEFTMLFEPFLVTQKGLGGAAAAAAGGFVSREAVSSALRGGALSPKALAAVYEAYDLLLSTSSSSGAAAAAAAADNNVGGGSGGPTIGLLKHKYDGKCDLRAKAGAMTRVEAKAEFARQWPLYKSSTTAIVSLADFTDYYSDVGGALDDDFLLSQVIANAWHVPGKGDWLVKKDKRVLVTFHKGSSTEAIIPFGEDIHDDDFEALTAALAKMKFGGVARIKVLGLVERKEE